MSSLRSLVDKHGFTGSLYQCGLGAATQKPTRLATNLKLLQSFLELGWPTFERDKYMGPLPKSCGHGRPQPLIGSDGDGKFKTSKSASYPSEMCFVIAWSIVVQWLKSRTPDGGYKFSLPRISWPREVSDRTKAKLE
eukprot:12383478-Karenia_brevis.AAC.1